MVNIKQTKISQASQTLGKQEQAVIESHPLEEAMGKFEGEFWEATLAEVQRLRNRDRKELETSLDTGNE
jgi:hypothetical protein